MTQFKLLLKKKKKNKNAKLRNCSEHLAIFSDVRFTSLTSGHTWSCSWFPRGDPSSQDFLSHSIARVSAYKRGNGHRSFVTRRSDWGHGETSRALGPTTVGSGHHKACGLDKNW